MQHTQNFVHPSQQHQQSQIQGRTHVIGFNGYIFPVLGSIVSGLSIIISYKIARSQSDVPPFPWTDITHTGIKYPEYIPLRIGLMVGAALFFLTFQLLKNYLEITSFQILGVPQQKVKSFGILSLISCFLLCISTASMSDGGDMNWTLHVFGATSFFIISLYIVLQASSVYRKLWSHKHFCPKWSYQLKKYANFIVGIFLLLTIAQSLQWIDIGSFVQWAATFYLMVFFFSLYWDCKDMEIAFVRG